NVNHVHGPAASITIRPTHSCKYPNYTHHTFSPHTARSIRRHNLHRYNSRRSKWSNIASDPAHSTSSNQLPPCQGNASSHPRALGQMKLKHGVELSHRCRRIGSGRVFSCCAYSWLTSRTVRPFQQHLQTFVAGRTHP